MEDIRENSDQRFSTILFITLFTLFAVIFSGNRVTQKSNSDLFPVTQESMYLCISNHTGAVVSGAIRVTDYQNFCIESPALKNIPLFSIKYKLSDFNNRITESFIQVCQERFQFEPVLLRELLEKIPFRAGGDIPVLS